MAMCLCSIGRVCEIARLCSEPTHRLEVDPCGRGEAADGRGEGGGEAGRQHEVLARRRRQLQVLPVKGRRVHGRCRVLVRAVVLTET